MQSEHLAFRALSDPTRRQILRMLASDSMTIAEIAERFEMTRAAIKKHLIILEEGDLISTQVSGRTRVSSLNPKGLKTAVDWFDHFDTFWDDRLSALKSEIEKDLQ